MSDRVAVMDGGVLQQVAAPRTLYSDPATPFVARFVGETNALPGRIASVEGGVAQIETPLGAFRGRAGAGARAGAAGAIYIRPEALVPGSDGPNRLAAEVDRVDFEGAFALVHGRFPDGSRLVAGIPGAGPGAGTAPQGAATFGFSQEQALVLADG